MRLGLRCGGMSAFSPIGQGTPIRPASSVIRGAWYLPERRQLDLLFTSGRRYVYSGVPLAVATGLAEAESKGRFYNREIRNRFPCREVGRERERRAA